MTEQKKNVQLPGLSNVCDMTGAPDAEGAVKRKRAPKLTEKAIVGQFAGIAFDSEAKASDRLRALGWLADNLADSKAHEDVMAKLDEVLAKIGQTP